MRPPRPGPRKRRLGVPAEDAIASCPHGGFRIRIQVTTDLAFEYCPHCEVRGWWSRGRGQVPEWEALTDLGRQDG